MHLLDKTYIFQKARNKNTGEKLERESRRKGHKLNINVLQVGTPLVFSYKEGGVLSTSRVESFEVSDGEIVVSTLNSVYTFSEE